MSKISRVLSGLINRRSYGVYARPVDVQVSAAAAVGTTAGGAEDGAAGTGRATSNKDVFWMRDPKTGCWIPENRFQEVDTVELRKTATGCSSTSTSEQSTLQARTNNDSDQRV